MLEQKQRIYEFDNFRLDVLNRELSHHGQAVALPAKAFEMLVVLIENRGRLIEKEELFQRVWPDQIVEESNLTVQVSAIRKALGDRKENPQYIRTVPGHGYRFVGNLLSLDEEEVEIERHSISRMAIEVEGASKETSAARISGAEVSAAKIPGVLGWRNVLLASLVLIAISTAVFLLIKRTWAPNTAASVPTIRSIAVLPFKPLVADDRDESLEVGLADTIITRLSRQRQVIVRPTSAVRRYATTEVDAVAVGREQRVEAVLDGSIQKSADRIRVTVRLVNVADGRQLWSEKFDEKSTDIFRIQDSIAQQVAAALMPLTGGEKELLARRDTEDPEAYSFYIKGRYFWNKRTPESIEKSIEFFNQAIARDPNYALAYVGLADAYVILPTHANASMSETHPKARAYAQRALEINNQLPEAYVTLASIAADYWQWSEANRQFLRALEMNPNYATAHQWYGEYLVHTGRLDEALNEFRRALELDPTSLIINALLGETLYHKRRYDESIEQCRKTLEMDRDFMVAHWFLAMNYQQKAMHQEAVSEFEKAVSLSPGATSLLALLGAAYQKAGNREAALAVREKLTALLKQNPAHLSDMAIIHIAFGEKEQALQLLEKAYQNHEYLLLYIGIDPIFDPLRSEPRFADLVRRVELSS